MVADRAIVLDTTGAEAALNAAQAYVAAQGTRVVGLAKAIARSKFWREAPGCRLVVRSSPRPVLAVVGKVDEVGEHRIKLLHKQLRAFSKTFYYIGYSQAEQDCEALAEQLVERLGKGIIQDAWFIPIPRGGKIVLGMLAYILDLRADQLAGSWAHQKHQEDLIVVDDCALTGARFGRFLRQIAHPRVTFAHLYSHPQLRRAIEEKEIQVNACISARDLHDYAPERLGSDYDHWQESWRARQAEPHYWVGQHEHICFAWNEPDRGFWDPANDKVEPAWQLVPPEFCLKNRTPIGEDLHHLQIVAEGKGPLKLSDEALSCDLDDRIVLAQTGTGECFSLRGVSADMWRAVLEHGNETEATAALLLIYDVEERTLRSDLDAFVGDLLAKGLLERRAPAA